MNSQSFCLEGANLLGKKPTFLTLTRGQSTSQSAMTPSIAAMGRIVQYIIWRWWTVEGNCS